MDYSRLHLKEIHDGIYQGSKIHHLNESDFGCAFLPCFPEEEPSGDLFEATREMQRVFQEPRYASRIFNANTERDGMKRVLHLFLDAINHAPEEAMARMNTAAENYLSAYRPAGIESRVQKMLIDLVDQHPDWIPKALLEYLGDPRSLGADRYPEILRELYLYALTYREEDWYLPFFKSRQKMMNKAKTFSFPLEKGRTFASGGKEATVIQTLLAQPDQSPELDVSVSFAPVLVRKEIPDWASVVFFNTAEEKDISDLSSFSFSICQKAPQKSGGLRSIHLEVKPCGKNWMHFSKVIPLNPEWTTVTVPLSEIETRTLKLFDELCFVITLDDFIALDTEEDLNGGFLLREIRLNA